MTNCCHFPPEFRTTGVLPRWSVVWTLNKDSVAGHSFFVTFYAHQIARLIEWNGDYADLMYRALTHDVDEVFIGDICGPVKREIIDATKAAAYTDRMMRLKLPTISGRIDQIGHTVEIDKIVKAADCLDALLFLVVEKRMGNGVIAKQIPRAWDNLRAAWGALPGQNQEVLEAIWASVVIPAVKEHEHNGGFGV